MSGKFKLGDIVMCTTDHTGNVLITSKESNYYNAKYISGCMDGQRLRIYDESLYDKIGNIFNNK